MMNDQARASHPAPAPLLAAVLAAVLAAAILISLLAVAVAAAAPTVKPRTHPWTAVIASPPRGAVVHGRAVAVEVQLRPAVRSFRATLRARGIGGEFQVRGRRAVAQLAIGKTPGLRFGRNTVRVRTSDGKGQRGYTSVSFYLVRKAPGLLRRVAARSTGDGARLRLDLRRAGTRLAVRVNGGPLLRRHPEGRHTTLKLDADDGLRPGRNRIRVHAVDREAGLYAVRGVGLLRPADLPVAGAGKPLRRGVNRVVRLDASGSAAPRGYRLRYRWRIVAAPRGSEAQLRGASRARPTLRPDRPGHYVFEVGVAKARRGAGASASASAPFAPEASARTTLTAPVSAPPIGVPIDTIAKQGEKLGVLVGTEAGGGGFFPVPEPGKALQLVAFERSTLAEVQNKSFANDVSGAEALLKAVEGLKSTELVVITKPNPALSSGESAAAGALINRALAKIGVAPILTEVSTGNGTPCVAGELCSSFAAIGVPGIPVGEGDVNAGMLSPPGAPVREASELRGYLQQNLDKDGFVFVNRERVPFDTGAPGAVAEVTVGGASYKSEDPGGPGFFVVVLDAGDLSAVSPAYTYSVAAPRPNSNVRSLEQLHTDLQRWAANPYVLVVVRSLGALSRQPTASWDAVAADLQQLGGSRFYLQALDGTTSSEFAQVGIAGQPGPGLAAWTQVASQERTGSGRLAGLLARNSNSMFYPAEAAAPGTPAAGTLPGLLSLPSEPWPLRSDPAANRIIECINEAFEFKLAPLQANYLNSNDKWADHNTRLRSTAFFGELQKLAGCGSFSEAEFETVRKQISAEFEAVATVYELFRNIASPFNGVAGQNADLQSVADAVNEEVGTGSKSVEYDTTALFSDVLWIGSELFPEGGEFLDLASGALGLASDLAQTPAGANELTNVRVAADELGETLQDEYLKAVEALGHEEAIVLTNWNMLREAAANAENLKGAAANWEWSPEIAAAADNGMALSSRRVDFRTLFPDRYTLYRAEQGTGKLGPSVASYACVWKRENRYLQTYLESTIPFRGAPAGASFAAVATGSGQIDQWLYAGPDNGFIEGGETGVYPPEKLMQTMFVAPQTKLASNAPLFGRLPFALETFGNGSVGTQVIHVEVRSESGSSPEGCRVE